ncbi:MAG: DUF2520 domain-containing protein [Ignavibacteria bacterium]|nr:DUF2520 domain-containing protein [Ignavibacteria bacterium]
MSKSTVIGFGKLGKALSYRLLSLNRLSQIVSRHIFNTADIENFKGKVQIEKNLDEIKELSNSIFICKADTEIEKISKELETLFPNELKGKIIVHCSGIYSDDILSNLKSQGAYTASAHPLQTFYNYHPAIFESIFWVVQSNFFNIVRPILEEIGGKAIQVEFNQNERNCYHASAVVSSNYLNSLLYIAKEMISKTGLAPAILLPLIQQTLQNNFKLCDDTSHFPISGPIPRKDFATIEKHLSALEEQAELKEIYSYFLLITAKVAKQRNLLNQEEFEQFYNIFKQHTNTKFQNNS